MKDIPNYPENRLDIRIDEKGKMSFQKNREFARYYLPTREEKEEELEEMRDRLELLEIDEPVDLYSDEHDEWEEERQDLEDRIAELETEIEEMK